MHAAFTEPGPTTMHNISEKRPSLVQQPQESSTAAAKQNVVPPTSQGSIAHLLSHVYLLCGLSLKHEVLAN